MIRERTKEVIKFPSFDDIQLSTLFEIVRQDSLMLYSESHLIRASFRWAAAQVKRQCLPNTGANLRSVLGLTLYRLRFLAMTAKEFADGPAQSDILTADEKVAFFANISSLSSDMKVPDGFCCLARDRSRPNIPVPRFQLDSEQHTLGLCESGREKSKELHCHVSFLVNTPVLLSGVELSGQDRPNYAGATYWEAVDLTVQDTAYHLLAMVKFRGPTSYDKNFDVKLSEPLQLEPDRKYKLSVIFCTEGYYRKGKGLSKITNQNVFLHESRVAISNSSTFIRSLIYTKI